jgi:hypothetical protein
VIIKIPDKVKRVMYHAVYSSNDWCAFPTEMILNMTNISWTFNLVTKDLFLQLRPLPFKGSGKHKYSFRNIEVPSYPIHFCDCEEHCGPPEKANEEYAAALNRVASEKERSIMNSVMSKLLEKDTEQLHTEEVQKRDDDVNITEPSDAETEPSDSDTEPSDEENDLRIEETKETAEEDLDDLQMEETDDPSEEELDDDLVINIVPRKANKSVVQSNVATQAVNKVCILQLLVG